MSATQTKRVTIDLDITQHRKLKLSAKAFGINQQDLLSLIVDLTMANPDSIKPHAERFRRKKEAEAQRQQELARRAENLLKNLSTEQQEKLLAGTLDLSQL